VQASSTTRSTLGEQLFGFVKQLMLDPGADHLRAIEENDLSVSQVRALMVLACAEEPVPGARLAERLGFSPAAVSRALDGLVRDGLAVRSESSEDRRVRPFAATARGRELADELSALRRAQLDRFVERLEPDQRDALAAAMDLIVGQERA
jgi:DNA-binding MarR family transcriptional regulator